MDRYRTVGPLDDPSMDEGDAGWTGTDSYTTPENLPQGIAQAAVNMDFSSQDAVTRGGFVCLPELGEVPFGMTWTSAVSASASNWNDIAYGAGLFVAVGSGSGIQTSPDGITWTARTAATTSGNSGICWSGSLFVAVGGITGDPQVQTSPDGITWTARAASSSKTWRKVAFGNGLFVACGTAGVAGTAGIMTSPDGITWTDRTTPDFGGSNIFLSICYGNGLFISFAATRVITSSDAITWSAVPVISGAPTWTDAAYGSGIFVLIGGNGKIFTTSDGVDYTQRTSPNSNAWSAISYGGANSGFASVAQTGSGDTVTTSINGIGWSQRNGIPSGAWLGVAFGAGIFVAVGTGGVAMYSNTSGKTVFASGTYSNPSSIGDTYTVLVGATQVGFYAFGKTSRTVNITSGETVSEQSTIVQCNNLVYIFRGPDETPLYWDGDWGGEFTLAPTPTPATGFQIIPNSNQATYYQNRLWVKNGKDTISASDVLDFNAFDELANDFNLNTGDSNFLVTTFPFGENSLIVFKNRSILLLQGVDGALGDVTSTEITRQVGAIGINSVVSVGPDLVYMSDRNINLLSLTTTNNAVQHKILPLSTPIQKILDRVNWDYAYKVSMGYWDNKLYVALPLDNATVCSSVVVYNFVTDRWYGEWNFNAGLSMAIQGWATANYLGLQRLHAVTEGGRIFVTNEGPNDISGTNVFEIECSLTTRPYVMTNDQKFSRRVVLDISTNRPTFSVFGYTGGQGSEVTIIEDRSYARSESWLFSDSAYSLNNANDDYNRPWRKDYAGYPSESIQAQSGFLPQALQSVRLPLVTRRKARLQWYEITNSTGYIQVSGISLEAISGDRQSTPQVG
jgi:hypothetical protein